MRRRILAEAEGLEAIGDDLVHVGAVGLAHRFGEAGGEAGEIAARRAVVAELIVPPHPLDRLFEDGGVADMRAFLAAALAQILRQMEDVAEHRRQQPLVLVALAVLREELLQIVQHADEARGIGADMRQRTGFSDLLVVLDQVLPGMAHHVGHAEEHHADRLPADEVVELALVVAHHDGAAVDERDRRIRGKRHRALVHHRDLGCHSRALPTLLPKSIPQARGNWEAGGHHG